MRVAFLDDSEQASPPRAGLGHPLAFAAAILPEESLAPYAEDLSGIATDLGIPAGEEIKWNPPSGSFLRSADGQLVKALRRRMLEAALDHHVRTVRVFIDHGAPLPGPFQILPKYSRHCHRTKLCSGAIPQRASAS